MFTDRIKAKMDARTVRKYALGEKSDDEIVEWLEGSADKKTQDKRSGLLMLAVGHFGYEEAEKSHDFMDVGFGASDKKDEAKYQKRTLPSHMRGLLPYLALREKLIVLADTVERVNLIKKDVIQSDLSTLLDNGKEPLSQRDKEKIRGSHFFKKAVSLLFIDEDTKSLNAALDAVDAKLEDVSVGQFVVKYDDWRDTVTPKNERPVRAYYLFPSAKEIIKLKLADLLVLNYSPNLAKYCVESGAKLLGKEEATALVDSFCEDVSKSPVKFPKGLPEDVKNGKSVRKTLAHYIDFLEDRPAMRKRPRAIEIYKGCGV